MAKGRATAAIAGGSLLGALWAVPAAAQDPAGSDSGLGPLTGRWFGYARAPLSEPAHDPWQQVSSSLWLQLHPRAGDWSYAHLAASLDALFASAVLEETMRLRLREAYAGAEHGGWHVKLGQQLVPWGVSDGFNPTDLLSSSDMRIFSGDPEARRLGAPMLWASWTPNDGDSPFQLIAVAVPRFASSRVLVRPALLPPGVTDLGLERPAAVPSNSEFAGKAVWHGEGWDVSMMAFTGWNHVPHYVLRSWSASGVEVAREHQRQHAVGADASAEWRSWVFRAESAWVWNANRGARDPQVAPPRWDSVLGLERPFLTWFRFQSQLVWRYHPAWSAPSSLTLADPVESYLRREVAAANATLLTFRFRSWPVATARLSFATTDEKLEAEVFAALQLQRYSGEQADWVLRPMVTWRATDALRARLGAELFRGPANGAFGALRSFSGAFTEAELAF